MFTEKIRGGHADDQQEVREVCSGSGLELEANLLGSKLACLTKRLKKQCPESKFSTMPRDHPRA